MQTIYHKNKAVTGIRVRVWFWEVSRTTMTVIAAATWKEIKNYLNFLYCETFSLVSNCEQNYFDYHRCRYLKGEDYVNCNYFKSAYMQLCHYHKVRSHNLWKHEQTSMHFYWAPPPTPYPPLPPKRKKRFSTNETNVVLISNNQKSIKLMYLPLSVAMPKSTVFPHPNKQKWNE